MSFVLEQQTVFDEFNSVITPEISDQLRAHIAGGHAGLHRYAVAAEKTLIALGVYDPDSALTYSWPDKAAGSLVDLSYVKLWVDDALLLFFTDAVGSGGTIESVGGSLNRIATTAAGFKTATGYPRNTALKDRDVRRGDVIRVWEDDPDEAFTTYVEDLIPDVIAPVTGAATADVGNAATQVLSSSINQTAGGTNQVEGTVNDASYNGLPTGDINETYTVTVTTAGVPASARLNVRSASGRDDVANVTPAAFASPTTIGTRGLTVTFDLDTGVTPDVGLPEDEFVVGQTWTVEVHQAFTIPTLASGGTYAGAELNSTFTYTVTVSTGGTMGTGSPPSITAYRSDGVDSSGPTTVPTSAQAVAIGSLGITITFTGTKLRKGDVYYVPITSQKHGAYKTLLLGQNMPSALAAAADLHVELYIRKNVSIPPRTAEVSPEVNWTATQSGITVEDGLEASDATLTDGGVAFSVPIKADALTTLYAEYREWLTTYTQEVTAVTPAGRLPAEALAAAEAALGPAHPDNPLAYAVYKALLNANGTKVYFTSVSDPTSAEDWAEVPPMLEGLTDLASLVPLTEDPAVHQIWIDHCEARSDDEIGGEWRSCWLPLVAEPSVSIIDADTPTAGGDPLLGTLTANTAVVGSPVTLFTCTSANGKFITNAVQVGDVLRFLYQINPYGDVSYQEFSVAQVVNEDVLILAAPHTSAVAVAQTFEVWRNQSRSQVVATMTAAITAADSKRARYVWPDVASDAGVSVEGVHLCAALAGFASGIAPHQSMRNVSVAGFDSVPGAVTLSSSQLGSLSSAGCVVVSRSDTGKVYVSHARTTDPASVDVREEMIVRNDDAFAHFLYRRCQNFLGQTNITDTGLAMIMAGVTAAISTAKGGTLIDRIGAMITDGKVTELRPHTTQEDRIVLVVTRTRPYPANEATVTLVM